VGNSGAAANRGVGELVSVVSVIASRQSSACTGSSKLLRTRAKKPRAQSVGCAIPIVNLSEPARDRLYDATRPGNDCAAYNENFKVFIFSLESIDAENNRIP
jgi:hypothetical protein